MNYFQNNKLENLQKKLKINIMDSQRKKIKLKIISMKLIFEPINNDNIKNIDNDYNFEDYQEIYNYKNEITEIDDDMINNNKNIITFPLSYAFLFYANEIGFFKDIILSSIKFTNNYQKVLFEENEIYTALRRIKDKKKLKVEQKFNERIYKRRGSIKLHPKGNILKKTSKY